jgi:hypothetical protein
MEWKDWGSVAFTEWHRLPPKSGIYIVADANDCVWYVGQAKDLKARWAARGSVTVAVTRGKVGVQVLPHKSFSLSFTCLPPTEGRLVCLPTAISCDRADEFVKKFRFY